ncbi:hypothetical protein D9C73_017230 [Collichthys lucidus]|uniref:Uncharacterized protein n=1 Tax=Collichthys lucidus TaxID=240159 RepID=A0A4U5V702_COLLU|nr:hypothetical protein D9C73_017230 [Collichthys lucidus]
MFTQAPRRMQRVRRAAASVYTAGTIEFREEVISQSTVWALVHCVLHERKGKQGDIEQTWKLKDERERVEGKRRRSGGDREMEKMKLKDFCWQLELKYSTSSNDSDTTDSQVTSWSRSSKNTGTSSTWVRHQHKKPSEDAEAFFVSKLWINQASIDQRNNYQHQMSHLHAASGFELDNKREYRSASFTGGKKSLLADDAHQCHVRNELKSLLLDWLHPFPFGLKSQAMLASLIGFTHARPCGWVELGLGNLIPTQDVMPFHYWTLLQVKETSSSVTSAVCCSVIAPIMRTAALLEATFTRHVLKDNTSHWGNSKEERSLLKELQVLTSDELILTPTF